MGPTRRWLGVLGLGVAAVMAGCSRDARNAAAPTGLTPVILQTNWYAEAEHGGYYEALAKGYYRAEGLDVRIVQGGPGSYPVQKIATGQVQFALGRSDDLIVASQQRIPVLIVSAELEHDPQIVLVHADSPVHGFADLDGKSIMVEPGSAWITYLEQKYAIHIHTIPENFGTAQFAADKNFIQQGFLTAEPFVFQQQKVAARFLLIADSGYDPYRVVFCTRDYARSHPEVVKAFVRASIRGWRDCLDGDPSPANTLINRDFPDSTPAVLAYSWGELKRVHIVDGDAAKGERIGLISRRRLENQVRTLQRLGMIPAVIPVDQFASFDFLPPDLQELARR
jgi:NitT/TauT family transport system substrate-binding protein